MWNFVPSNTIVVGNIIANYEQQPAKVLSIEDHNGWVFITNLGKTMTTKGHLLQKWVNK